MATPPISYCGRHIIIAPSSASNHISSSSSQNRWHYWISGRTLQGLTSAAAEAEAGVNIIVFQIRHKSTSSMTFAVSSAAAATAAAATMMNESRISIVCSDTPDNERSAEDECGKGEKGGTELKQIERRKTTTKFLR